MTTTLLELVSLRSWDLTASSDAGAPPSQRRHAAGVGQTGQPGGGFAGVGRCCCICPSWTVEAFLTVEAAASQRIAPSNTRWEATAER